MTLLLMDSPFPLILMTMTYTSFPLPMAPTLQSSLLCTGDAACLIGQLREIGGDRNLQMQSRIACIPDDA